MAVKSVKTNILKKPGMRIGLVVSTFMVVLCVMIFVFWLASRSLFSQNGHFAIRHVDVKSSGWWNGKGADVSKLLELKTGSTNLFAVNLRQICEKLAAQPSIDKVTVSRILPDTIQINIIERIPRAFLYNSNSQWIVDSNGIVMESKSCVNLRKNLPVITGFKADTFPLTPGQDMPQLRQALDLIMIVVKKYPEIKILKVSLSTPREIQMSFLTTSAEVPLCAILPRSKIDEKMTVLRDTLRQRKATNNPAITIDLRFEGQVILKPPEIED
ncbi:MAG: FtsQ-type POTRA domain-containing protein [Victivallales bacterium]|jgi:cell division septal protein FtsQ